MHMIAECSSEKLSLHRIQNRVRLYGCLRFSAIMVAIRLYTTVAIGPIPPEEGKLHVRQNGGLHRGKQITL